MKYNTKGDVYLGEYLRDAIFLDRCEKKILDAVINTYPKTCSEEQAFEIHDALSNFYLAAQTNNLEMKELGIKSLSSYPKLLQGGDEVKRVLGLHQHKCCENCKHFLIGDFRGVGYYFTDACMILGDYFPINLEGVEWKDAMACDRWEEE